MTDGESTQIGAASIQFSEDGTISGNDSFDIGQLLPGFPFATVETVWLGKWKKVSKLQYTATVIQIISLQPFGGNPDFPIARVKRDTVITVDPTCTTFTDVTQISFFDLEDLAMTSSGFPIFTVAGTWAKAL